MQRSSNTTPPAVPTARPIEVTSAELSRMLRGKSNGEKADIAAKFSSGIYILVGPPSKAQAAHLCAVPPTYLTAALGHTGRRGARDRTIKRLVRKYSSATLLRALDRATAPAGNGHAA